MFLERLKRLASRLVGRRPPGSGPSQDPHVGVRQPRKPGPGGRHSSVALAEPEPDRSVGAVGASSRTDQR